MTSGGARGNSGRTADPNALRRDRAGDSATWLTLENPDMPTPEFPLEDLTQREAVIWARLWSKPQASQWHILGLEDEVALYARYLAEAEKADASSAVRTLVKQHQELLGLSTAGLSRLRWRIGTGEQVKQSAPRKRSSSRTRLKVVEDVG
jgi:hypothetical protein